MLKFKTLLFERLFRKYGKSHITENILNALSAIRVVSSAYLRLLIFLPAILIPACAHLLLPWPPPCLRIGLLLPLLLVLCSNANILVTPSLATYKKLVTFFPSSRSSLSFPLTLLFSRTFAAAKSLQSCPTLCDPLDGSPPGSPVPGILQARTLEWVTISFSGA